MEYVVLAWWWYSHNKQLAVDVAVGGVGKLVVILVLTLVVVVSEPQRSRPKKR